MSGLSNLWPKRDGPKAHVRPVAEDEVAIALSLLLGDGRGLAEPRQVEDFRRLAGRRGIELSRLVVATLDGRLAAAALPVPSPGRTVLLLLSPAGRSTLAASLLTQCATLACDRMPGGPLVQVLLDANEARVGRTLQEAGFEPLATLIYLQRGLRRAAAAPAAAADGLHCVHYAPDTHARFARAIEASYENSLDCPAMRGLRSIDDVIAGHKATGDFDPDLWFCFTDGDGADAPELGVLLLSPVTQQPMMELVYLGLSPAARGKRLADRIMRLAMRACGERGLDVLTLAVDDRNVPALRLYYRHGLAEIARRDALLRRPAVTAPSAAR